VARFFRSFLAERARSPPPPRRHPPPPTPPPDFRPPLKGPPPPSYYFLLVPLVSGGEGHTILRCRRRGERQARRPPFFCARSAQGRSGLCGVSIGSIHLRASGRLQGYGWLLVFPYRCFLRALDVLPSAALLRARHDGSDRRSCFGALDRVLARATWSPRTRGVRRRRSCWRCPVPFPFRVIALVFAARGAIGVFAPLAPAGTSHGHSASPAFRDSAREVKHIAQRSARLLYSRRRSQGRSCV
jgi:hypothetical protein